MTAELTAREKMLQRVLNLRAKASNEAASENEVMTALALAEKLMTSYQIEEAELCIAEATGKIKIEVVHKTADVTCTKGDGAGQKHKIVLVLGAINSFSNVRSVMKWNGSIEFTGDRADVEIANYLTALIKRALDDEYTAYRKANPQVGYGAKASFQNAMANRISKRLYDMVREREEEMQRNAKEAKAKMLENQNSVDKQSSTALVIVDIAKEKREKVAEEFAMRNPRLGVYRATTRSTNGNAFSAGRAAGDRLNLGRSLNAAKTKAIA